MNRPPGLQTIAEKAGVSVATVSLALRDKGRISDETRCRIKRLADELGYTPNAAARSLVGGRTELIAISMPALGVEPGVVGSVEYFARLLSAATAAAFERDYGMILVPPAGQPDRVGVDGGVVVDPAEGDPALASFDRRGWPVVTIGRRVGTNGANGSVRRLAVDSDILGGTERVLDHLAERGARRIGILATEPIDSFERDSLDAYRGWCRGRGIEPTVVVSKGMEDHLVLAAVRRMLDSDPVPDAIYATIDKIAFFLLDQCSERGLDVPGDLLVATCGESDRVRRAGLTVLDDRPAELGRSAVRMLIGAIRDPDGGSAEELVGTELVVRASTG